MTNNNEMASASDEQMREILETLLADDEDITARAVARLHPSRRHRRLLAANLAAACLPSISSVSRNTDAGEAVSRSARAPTLPRRSRTRTSGLLSWKPPCSC